ncbi:cytochrome P450 [Streptomyces orinoci]|uniref:Cytochrome P450 n=1 Tax=Streptomyces orinoci TaxID=67339 RepID=A0ABV3K7N2_STRON|nr:cytochrome P450 [Streptomyces orinoci]
MTPSAPSAWPLVGHLPRFARDPLGFLRSLPAQGEVVRIRLGGRQVFVPCGPEAACRALADGHTFDRTGPLFDRIRAEMGNGLATCPQAEHHRQRLLLRPAFQRERLERYRTVMEEESAALADRWCHGQVIDVVDAMFGLTVSVAVRTLFSSRIGPGTTAALRQCLDVFLRGSYTRALLPLSTVLPTPANRRFDRALVRWRHYVRQLIDEARRRPAGGPDLLSALLEARDGRQGGLSEAELADQIAVLVLAGAETTSAALSWTWHLLAAHPDAEAELHAGLDSGGPDPAALDHVHRVVKESLRLYPPAWAIPRTVTRETMLAGHRLPAGATLLFSPYVLHHRPDLHPEPERFRPERWLPGGTDRRARAAFLPFGAGPTRCIGESFALTETTVALTTIASHWQLRPLPGHLVHAAARSVLAPRTLPMRLVRRRRP